MILPAFGQSLQLKSVQKAARLNVGEAYPGSKCDFCVDAFAPRALLKKYEHYTAPLEIRISQLRQAAAAGFLVRICFDPLIYIENFKEVYGALVRQVFSEPVHIMDASIGVFRVSVDYLKQIAGTGRAAGFMVPFLYLNREFIITGTNCLKNDGNSERLSSRLHGG